MIAGVDSEFLLPTDYSPALPPSGATLRHIVCFKFQGGVGDEAKQALVAAFANLQADIDCISDFEWGLNIGPEGKDHGFTHCFCLTFSSEKDRDAYLPHPLHKAFGATFVRPIVADVFVADYWAYDSRYVAVPPSHGGNLRHLVCYSFDTDTPELQRIARASWFGELQRTSDAVRSFEWGPNNRCAARSL